MTDLAFSPYDYAIHEDPYPTYARLRDDAPLFHNPEVGFWALSRHADVIDAFRDPERFSSAYGVSLDPAAPMAERVATVLGDIAGLVAAEPRLAAACSPALLADDPDVAVLRDRIGGELHRRLRQAVGDGDDAGTLAGVLDLMLAGALLRAGMGHVAYDDLAGMLAGAARVVIGDRP